MVLWSHSYVQQCSNASAWINALLLTLKFELKCGLCNACPHAQSSVLSKPVQTWMHTRGLRVLKLKSDWAGACHPDLLLVLPCGICLVIFQVLGSLCGWGTVSVPGYQRECSLFLYLPQAALCMSYLVQPSNAKC
jgi:hypothetical protein